MRMSQPGQSSSGRNSYRAYILGPTALYILVEAGKNTYGRFCYISILSARILAKLMKMQ